MRREEILAVMTQIVRREVDDEAVELTETSTSDDVLGWDSIAHIGIIVGVEEKCGITFEPAQITSFNNVGEIVDAIERLKRAP